MTWREASWLRISSPRAGASVAIVPMYEQGVDVPRLGLDTLVANYARAANLDLMRSFAEAGLALYVLATPRAACWRAKGGNSPPAMAAYVRGSGYADILSGYFFWGDRLHAAFNDNQAMRPGQLHLTGALLDFAAPKWRTLLDGERRGYLLVNANFPPEFPLLQQAGH